MQLELADTLSESIKRELKQVSKAKHLLKVFGEQATCLTDSKTLPTD